MYETTACYCSHGGLEKAVSAVAASLAAGAEAEPALESGQTVLEAGGCQCSYGVESLTAPTDLDLYYLNTGDTYTATVAVEVTPDGRTSAPFVTSWGDWLEDQERLHCEDTGEIRCGYCGEYTHSADDWRETRCEHCGHNVSTGVAMPEPTGEDEE